MRITKKLLIKVVASIIASVIIYFIPAQFNALKKITVNKIQKVANEEIEKHYEKKMWPKIEKWLMEKCKEMGKKQKDCPKR